MDTSTSLPLTVAQAAQHAHVATKTIRRWLASGRLEATRGPDGAWLIELEAIERAITTPGPSTDSPALATGRGQVASLVQSLLDRLEAQAQRIGQLDAELVSTRAQLAEVQGKLLALEAPKADSPEIALGRDSERVASDPTRQPSTDRRRAWWQIWRRATA